AHVLEATKDVVLGRLQAPERAQVNRHVKVDAPLAGTVPFGGQRQMQVLVELRLTTSLLNHRLMQIARLVEAGELPEGGDSLVRLHGPKRHGDGARDLHFAEQQAGGPITLEDFFLVLEHDSRMTDIVADAQVPAENVLVPAGQEMFLEEA